MSTLPTVVAFLFLALWLFIPAGAIDLGLLLLRKQDVVRLLPLLMVAVIDWKRLRFRWRWIDVAVVLFCCAPCVSALLNQLPATKAVLESIKEFGYWFVPYWLGRAVFATESAQRSLSVAVVMMALMYIPPAIYEVFNGPVLNALATGEELGRQLRGAERGSTFRPSVFLASGFVLTMFFALAAMSAIMLGFYADQPRWRRVSWGIAAVALMTCVVLAKSLGSILLMTLGIVLVILHHLVKPGFFQAASNEEPSWRGRMANGLFTLMFAILLAMPLGYIGLRVSGVMGADQIEGIASVFVSAERAQSLGYRLRAEDLVFDSMAGHWWFGWGDFGRWHQGNPRLALDGFWLFALTRTGLVSVCAWLAMVLLPVGLFAFVFSRKAASDTLLVFSLFLALSMIDSLFNYFGAAPQMLLVGAVTGNAMFVTCASRSKLETAREYT